jgi:phosphatidylinositol-3-phosphatase
MKIHMKLHLPAITLALLPFTFTGTWSQSVSPHKPDILPKYSHIVMVIEENKGYSQVIGNKDAPYINDVLVKQGANLTKMFADEHNSEGNYMWIFSGSNQNVGFNDVIPTRENNPAYPFTAPNLGEELITAGYTFKGYSEDLPRIGDTISISGDYARKHVPWISFANVPDGSTEASSSNLQFKQFPKDFNKLPTVSIVIPNLIDDMHSGKPSRRVKDGDEWLRKNIDAYYRWAKTHNSLLIITFDENNDAIHYQGLTDPASKQHDIRNRIPTIIAGAHVRHGNFSEGAGVTHVNLLRTIEAIYGLPKAGRQQVNASRYGIKNDFIIRDIFSDN